jgi:hypothetical protein
MIYVLACVIPSVNLMPLVQAATLDFYKKAGGPYFDLSVFLVVLGNLFFAQELTPMT